MYSKTLAIALTLLIGVLSPAQETKQEKRQRNYPPQMGGATEKVYKKVGETELKIYIFQPKKHEANESRPAIVFFFGGGWKGGTPAQFHQHCKHLAARGMIAMSADYRVRGRQQTLADARVSDAKSAIRWIRANARELGVDPDRIVAGGGSAGGHIAACTATIDGFEQEGEDLKISSRPNGLALFNPAVSLASIAGVHEIKEEKLLELAERMGGPSERLSPFHNLKDKLPPTVLFHGIADTTVPFVTAKAFHEKAKELGTLSYLHGYKDEGHGFFNFGRKENKMYLDTVLKLDRFLVDHGLLEGPSPKDVKILP